MHKILIVEDETFVRFLYKELLSKNYDIDEATNGFEAVEMIESNNYKVILLDVNIPFINGIEILKKVKMKGIKSKIIVISAYGMSEKKDKAFELGAVDYLVKPIDLDVLKDKVEKWCQDEYTEHSDK